MPIHVTTSTNQTITGDKTFTGLISAASGFTFPDGTTQTTAFTGGAATPSDRLDNGTVQVVLSSDNNLVFPGGGYIGSQYGAAGWIVTPPAAGGLASADGEQYIQINNGQGIFIGTSWPASPHEWAFGRDGNLTFPDGTIQSTAFTNNLSTYAELSYVDNNFLNLTGGAVSGSVAIDGDVTIASILSTANVIYASGGNSDEWNNAYSTVNANSATWGAGGGGGTIDTGVRALTSNWQDTYTTFSAQSANNASVYSTVNANSATWAIDNTTDTGVRALTSNWQDTYTTFSAQSANNASVYSNVNANSAIWATGAGGGGGGILYYFNQATLAQSPTLNLPLTAHQLGRLGLSAQTTYTSPTISQVDYSLVAGFVTNVLDPYVNAIPGGIWDFNIWGFSNATANNPTVMQALVYTYDGINAPVLLSTSDDTTLTDTGIFIQLAMSCLVPQTPVSLSARIYVEFRARASASNKTVTLAFGDATPSHIHTTIPAAGGTGLVKVVDGVTQTPASLLVDADVAANANINQSKISGLTAVAHNVDSVYTTVNANSGTWGGGGSTIDTGVRALTANWESTYTTVQSNSSTWGTGGGSFIVEDANSIIGLSVFL